MGLGCFAIGCLHWLCSSKRDTTRRLRVFAIWSDEPKLIMWSRDRHWKIVPDNAPSMLMLAKAIVAVS